MRCCWDIKRSFTKEIIFMSTEAVHQTGKREDVQSIGKNFRRSRNMTDQALTEIQYITRWLPISKFTLRKTLLKMRWGDEQSSCLTSYVMSPNRNLHIENCLYQLRLAKCIYGEIFIKNHFWVTTYMTSK